MNEDGVVQSYEEAFVQLRRLCAAYSKVYKSNYGIALTLYGTEWGFKLERPDGKIVMVAEAKVVHRIGDACARELEKLKDMLK